MRHFVSALLCCLLLGTATIASAGDWRVIPIKLFFEPPVKSGSVRLINNDTLPLNLQVKAVTWSQGQDGTDIYEPTEDLIFMPRIMTIPAGKEQVLRAGIKIPATTTEKTYRLFIEEIPPATRSGTSGVSVAVRFGLPIFVAPLQPTHLAQISTASYTNGTFSATIKNNGNSHFIPSAITLRGFNAAGVELFSEKFKAWYLLPGIARDYSYTLKPGQQAELASLSFEAVDANHKLHKEVVVGQGAPAAH